MNPNGQNESSGMNLPPPVGETAPTVGPEVIPAVPEQAPAGAERAPAAPHAAPAALPTIAVPLPAGAQPQVSQAGVSATTDTDVPSTADDTDLIEKEWVSKAKAIVEQTKEDPYHQSKELTNLKADYMKQRYNKAIKLAE